MVQKDPPDEDGQARRQRYRTRKQLAADTGMSPATIHRLKREHKIPFFQPGGRGTRVVFPLDAIEAVNRHCCPQDSQAKDAAALAADQAPKQTTETTGGRKLSGPRPRWQTSQPGANKEA